MQNEELIYEILVDARADHQMVQAAIQKAWEEVRLPSSVARARAEDAGIDVDALPTTLSQLLSIRPAGAPLTTVELLVSAAGAGIPAAKIGLDMWKYVFLPHIRDKFGDKAIARKNAAAKKAATTQAASAKAAKKTTVAKKAPSKKTGA